MKPHLIQAMITLLLSGCVTHKIYHFDNKAPTGEVYQSKHEILIFKNKLADLSKCSHLKKVESGPFFHDKLMYYVTFGFLYRNTLRITCAR